MYIDKSKDPMTYVVKRNPKTKTRSSLERKLDEKKKLIKMRNSFNFPTIRGFQVLQ